MIIAPSTRTLSNPLNLAPNLRNWMLLVPLRDARPARRRDSSGTPWNYTATQLLSNPTQKP